MKGWAIKIGNDYSGNHIEKVVYLNEKKAAIALLDRVNSENKLNAEYGMPLYAQQKYKYEFRSGYKFIELVEVEVIE